VSDDATVAVDGAAGAPPPKSLKTRAIHAIGWTLVSDGGSQVVRVISTIVLTRLLVPDMFGLMGVVTLIQDGLNMFSDVGVQPAIVQHKRGDDRAFLDTAWTIQSIRGAFLWLAASVLAWPVSQYYNQPELAYLLPVVGFNSLIDGMVSTKVHTCDRHLALRQLTLINLGTSFLGLAVRIGWAMASPTVWALVAGGLASTIARIALGHLLLDGPINRFRWGREEVKELVGFGRWVFVSTLLTFVASRLDKFAFVKIVPISMFGVYGIAQSMCRLPMDALQRIGSSVAFPVFSRLKEKEGNVASAYERMRAPLLVGGGTALSALTLGGPLVAQILFPAKYHDAGWIMQIVAVAMWFQVLESTNASVLLASALPKWLAIGNFVKIVMIAAVLPIAYLKWGFAGALAGMALVEVPKYLVETVRVRRLGFPGWATDLGLTAAVLFCAAVAFALHFWIPGGPWLKLSIAGACGVVVWTPLLWWAARTARFTA